MKSEGKNKILLGDLYKNIVLTGVKHNNMSMKEKLGEGNFGTVYKGKEKCITVGADCKETTIVAYKTLKSEEGKKELIEEAKMHWTINGGNDTHENVVRIFGLGSCRSGKGVSCILIEFCNKGSLEDYLKSRGNRISDEQRIDFSLQIAKGMEYIHSKDILHFDLAARNVLMSESTDEILTLKIADFGLSEQLENGKKEKEYTIDNTGEKKYKPLKLATKWLHPEATDIYLELYYDTWSYGITVWEIFNNGRAPYSTIIPKKILDHVKEGNIIEPEKMNDAKLSRWIYDNIVKLCCDIKENTRARERNLTFTELISMIENMPVIEEPKPLEFKPENIRNFSPKNNSQPTYENIESHLVHKHKPKPRPNPFNN